MARTIFHVDMDAFYSSVEQRDCPQHKGRPVIVGADPKQGRGRGVVAACSYEAREYGIRSAMPISQAYRRCPDGVFLRPDFPRYADASRAIREIFRSFTDLVEPISIDEAFLDVTHETGSGRESLELAARLKREIYQRQKLTASVGIGPNKLVAKISSDWDKPNGLFMVSPEQVRGFLDPLPPSRIWGVGPKTRERLEELGVTTVQDLRQFDPKRLEGHFGRFGGQLWRLAQGIDERPVTAGRGAAKSISQEHTFDEDIDDGELLEATLRRMSEKVAARARQAKLSGRTIVLKLRYSDFTTITRQVSSRWPSNDAEEIVAASTRLLRQHRRQDRRIRLIGVGLANLSGEGEAEARQPRLFD